MRTFTKFFLCFFCALLLFGCGSDETAENAAQSDNQLNQIMAAKTRFALAKTATPVLNTHNWDTIFGGADGSTLKYDNFGEIDELVFVALPQTFFNVQRQIRKQTRKGVETIYFKVTTPDYDGSEELWVDGRFLDLRDVRPQDEREASTAAETLITLRRFEGAPYTWHGSSDTGVPDLIRYYPPDDDATPRTRDDWMLKGFDSLGMLYLASNGQTPLSVSALRRFGKPVELDFSDLSVDEGNDDPNALRIQQAQAMLTQLRPLDIIHMNERTWIVLDGSEVIESRYQSKFDGEVQINSLLDTAYGLLQKGVYVKNPFEELEDPQSKPFYIRRYANTSNLLSEQVDDADDESSSEEETSSNSEPEAEEEADDTSTNSDSTEDSDASLES